MTTTTYEFEKYIATSDTLKDVINRYGVAIIPTVLNEDECNDMVNGMWNTLEKWTSEWDLPINRDDNTTWKNFRDLLPKHSMLIQQYGLGHAQFIWNIRQNPKILSIFAKLWKCDKDDLLVSFDGASFHMPSEITKIGWFRKPWFHSDQSYTRNDFECVQSWVTGFDVNEGDATLGFYEKSNNFHKDFASNFDIKDKEDWFKIDTEEYVNFYKREIGCKEMYIKCPKGSMVFWDSRTIHCGVEPRKERLTKNFRCVVYLCYMPREKSDEKNIKKKVKAFEELRMTSHWPCKVKLFPKMPRTYGAVVKEVVPLDAPEISDVGRQLVGY